MREDSYRAISEAVKSSGFMTGYIVWFNRIVTTAVYLLYPALLLLLFFRSRSDLPLGQGFIPALLIPGISFILLSIIRDRIDAPRPYEVFDIAPIIDKKTTGHSFPSRHIFSIFVIATTVFYFYPAAGLLIGLTGVALAINRVLGGVHFIKDVLVGAAAGILCAVLGCYVILPIVLSLT